MARSLRIDEAGLTYHVWIHGVSDVPIFKAPDVKDAMLTFMREEAVLSRWVVLEYAVMSTHNHMVLRLTRPTLSSGFQRLHARFAQFYNRLHRRRGCVFDARFGSRIIGTKFDLLETMRYVARNPVTARMCDDPADWQWSSHGALAGLTPRDPIVNERAALAPFGGDRASYRAYVLEMDRRVRWGQAGARARDLTAALPPQAASGVHRR